MRKRNYSLIYETNTRSSNGNGENLLRQIPNGERNRLHGGGRLHRLHLQGWKSFDPLDVRAGVTTLATP